ncbi:hypothetical protein D3C71_1976010 [compost metagenome]
MLNTISIKPIKIGVKSKPIDNIKSIISPFILLIASAIALTNSVVFFIYPEILILIYFSGGSIANHNPVNLLAVAIYSTLPTVWV